MDSQKASGNETDGLVIRFCPYFFLVSRGFAIEHRAALPTTEHTVNDALAELLRQSRSLWRAQGIVTSETTGMLRGSSRRPDILIIEPNVSPVVIETEFAPATAVEREAMGRLGERLRATGRPLLSAIAVRLPSVLSTKAGQSLRDAIRDTAQFEMVMFAGISPSDFIRRPQTGWLRGGMHALSMLAQAASVPPQVVEAAADELVKGVTETAGLLKLVPPGALTLISNELRQEPGEQTWRMAATILANAFVFHETLAHGPGGLATVKTWEELRNGAGVVSKAATLGEWRTILSVNYWPIFDIARRILQVVPTSHTTGLITRLIATAEKLLQNRLMRSHDLTGAVFQRLIVDRKFLAAYYTTPSSAALLAALALPDSRPFPGLSWGADSDLRALRIADFACGTGTLLSSAYQRLGQLHELHGGDAEQLHPTMMSSVLLGCDVLPAAAHLTASMLSGAHPTVKYDGSRILAVPFGRQPGMREVALGSLDLLEQQGELDMLEITTRATGIAATGAAQERTWVSITDNAFDLVIMNAPFTRDTGQEGKKKKVRNPIFAAFKTTRATQATMAKKLQRLTAGTTAHGNAGEASIFLVLADRKLKSNATLALVMPLSLLSGEAWEGSRQLLRTGYRDLTVLSIAGREDAELSFSADTDMAECLIIASKGGGADRATFAILKARPATRLEGTSIATQISELKASGKLGRLEDGPIGGTPLQFGDEIVGHVVDAPLPQEGGWRLSRISDISLAQTAYQLANENRIWLPRMPRGDVVDIPITTAARIGTIGPYHADIDGRTQSGIRGPFDIRPLTSAATYPVLWSHDAPRQQMMMFGPDCEAVQRRGRSAAERELIERKATAIWESASHCHVNRDFRFNSQSTTMQFTPHRAIGGRAWPSLSFVGGSRESDGNLGEHYLRHSPLLVAREQATSRTRHDWRASDKSSSRLGRYSDYPRAAKDSRSLIR